MIIYKIENRINGKIYIGKSFNRDLSTRIIEHNYELNHNKHHSIYLQRSWNKYGKDAFTWSTVCQYFCVTEDELNEYEKYYIKFYKSNNKKFGYNMTIGGEGISGLIHTNESKRKMSIAQKGKIVSEETKKKMSTSSKGKNKGKIPWNKGIPHSEETLKKISLSLLGKPSAMKGKKHSEETKLKLSKANTGKKHTEETKEKLSKVGKGRVHSIETKKKMSIAQMGKTFSEETRKRMGIAQKGKIISNSTREKIRASLLGRKGKSLYNIWLEKYGEDIALIKFTEYKEKLRKSHLTKGGN